METEIVEGKSASHVEPAIGTTDGDHPRPLDVWLEQFHEQLTDDEQAIFLEPTHRECLQDSSLVAIRLARSHALPAARSLALAILDEAAARRLPPESIPTEEVGAIGLFLAGSEKLVHAAEISGRLTNIFEQAGAPAPDSPQSYQFALQVLCKHSNELGVDLVKYSSLFALGHDDGERLPRELADRPGERSMAFAKMANDANGMFGEIPFSTIAPLDDDLLKYIGGAVTFLIIAAIWIIRFLNS